MNYQSTSLYVKNLFPKPSPLEAPFTKPAISTKDIVVLIIFLDFEIFAKLLSRVSGTGTTPIFGSIAMGSLQLELYLNS